MLKGSFQNHLKVSIIDRAIRSPINGYARTSGIEPTPALTHIRRSQRAEERGTATQRESAIMQALQIIAQGEAEFLHESNEPELIESDNARVRFIHEMRMSGWVKEEVHEKKIAFLEEERRRLREQVVYLAKGLRNSLSDTSALEGLNNELRSAIEKLRAKVVEQDEIIKKLITRNIGKDRSIC